MKRRKFGLPSAIFLALQFPMLGQNFLAPETMKDFSDAMVSTPNTAMVITPTNVPPPDPNQNVPGDPTMTPPPAPYSPNSIGGGGSYEGPVGVTGYVGDTVTTGCSYSALSHSANRVIDDIVVPGSVGKYPLKMTRDYNCRQQYYAANAINLSPGWSHEYPWLLWGDGTKVISPHGNVYDFFCGAPLGMSEGWDDGNQGRHFGGNGTWRLADGGKVVFFGGRLTDIYDPYGLRTRIAYNASNQLVKVTEPGGRCLWFTYGSDSAYTDPDGTKMLKWVNAYDADGSPGVPTLPNGNLIERVTYTYTSIAPGGQYFPSKKMLTGVTYGDGTSAAYHYVGDNVPDHPFTPPYTYKIYPLLSRCDDVHYSGPMRSIIYTYNEGEQHGAIVNEKSPDVATPVFRNRSRCVLPTNNRANAK